MYIYISLYKPGSGAGALRNRLGPMADHGVSDTPFTGRPLLRTDDERMMNEKLGPDPGLVCGA